VLNGANLVVDALSAVKPPLAPELRPPSRGSIRRGSPGSRSMSQRIMGDSGEVWAAVRTVRRAVP